MILDHYGIDATLDEIETAAVTGPRGTSLLALKQFATAKGLQSQGLRLSMPRLKGLPMPVIAHVHGDHFVVLRSIDSDLVVDDPSVGRLRMSTKAFERAWDGVVLAFNPMSLDEAVPHERLNPSHMEGGR